MPSELRIYGDTTLFGVRVSFESNHRSALHAALSAFLQWNYAEFRQPETSIYIVLTACEPNDPIPGNSETIGSQLSVVLGGIALRADGARGQGICIFPADSVNTDAFREAINTLVLFLVAHAGRIPVHASATMLGERAIVMAGKSGSGKSSLALAANRVGLPILSEDTVFVQTEPSFCVWALAENIHLLEQDAPADLQDRIRVRSGRTKWVLPIATRRHRANQAMLCILARGDKPALEEIREEEAVHSLTRAPEPGYEFYGKRSAAAIRALAAGGCWRFTLSRDPDAAIAALLAEFRAHAPPPKVEEQRRG